MKITSISLQAKDKNRVNISVDGVYRFSLDVFQLSDLKIKTGNEYTENELILLEQESQFGKLYARALEYALMRPHSSKEIRDYLYRKTRPTLSKTGQKKEGLSVVVTGRVYDRLLEKKYIDDQRFAQYWIDNRSLRKGASMRKLSAELSSKGVDRAIIDAVITNSTRSDDDEIRKIILKKRSRYPDDKKLTAYLARQGFRYDDIVIALQSSEG